MRECERCLDVVESSYEPVFGGFVCNFCAEQLFSRRERITLVEFQATCAATFFKRHPDETNADRLEFFALCLAEECGEAIKPLRKYITGKDELDKASLREELGDILNVISSIAHLAGLKMEDVAMLNIKKREDRFGMTGLLDGARA